MYIVYVIYVIYANLIFLVFFSVCQIPFTLTTTVNSQSAQHSWKECMYTYFCLRDSFVCLRMYMTTIAVDYYTENHIKQSNCDYWTSSCNCQTVWLFSYFSVITFWTVLHLNKYGSQKYTHTSIRSYNLDDICWFESNILHLCTDKILQESASRTIQWHFLSYLDACRSCRYFIYSTGEL